VEGLTTALAAKAPLLSPDFSGQAKFTSCTSISGLTNADGTIKDSGLATALGYQLSFYAPSQQCTRVYKLEGHGDGNGWNRLGQYLDVGVGGGGDLKLELVGHSYWNNVNTGQDGIFLLRFKAGQTGAASQNADFQGSALAYCFSRTTVANYVRIVQESAGVYTFWANMPPWCHGTTLLVSGYPFTYDGSYKGASAPTVPARNVVSGQNAGGAYLDVVPSRVYTTADPPSAAEVVSLQLSFDTQRPWCAGVISVNSTQVAQVAQVRDTGRVPWTVSRAAAGYITVAWSAPYIHPYGVILTGEKQPGYDYCTVLYSDMTSTSFRIHHDPWPPTITFMVVSPSDFAVG
jgi:hypothetical protein